MERDLHKAKLKSLDFQKSHSDQNFKTKIWAVTSGKGGAGKTFVSTSLGISISKLGKSALIIDLDLHGANVHTSLGLSPSYINIKNFFDGKKNLKDLVLSTPLPKLSYIQGFWDSWNQNHLTLPEVENFFAEVKKLHFDFIIMDMGSINEQAQLELLRLADERFLISTPEPTCIEKNYRLLESYVCHLIEGKDTPSSYKKMITDLQNHRQEKGKKAFSWAPYLEESKTVNLESKKLNSSQSFKLIMNMSRSDSHRNLGYSIKSVCKKYYDLSLDYQGSVHFDNAVWQAMLAHNHALVEQTFTQLPGQFLGMCKLLIDPEELRAVV